MRRGELGYVHSEQTGSLLDGPGLRTVFFLSGCVMRCQYCHNPDTWKLGAGRPMRREQLVDEALRYAGARGSRGVTISGGEPLVQRAFALSVLERLHEKGLHTALDTNGYLGHTLSDVQLRSIDLVLLDLKAWDAHRHLMVTGVGRDRVYGFAERLAREGRPIWVRYVLVPGLTDAPAEVSALARFCALLGNVERVEVLPFHQLGREKWHRLLLPYELEEATPPSSVEVERVRDAFRSAGLLSLG